MPDDELTTQARRMLAGGVPPEEVFARLALACDDTALATIAVCEGLGVSPEESRRRAGARLVPDDGVPREQWARELGAVSALIGVFDTVAPVPRQDEFVRLVVEAMRTWRPSDRRPLHRFLLAVRAGQPHQALEHVRDADDCPPAYWQALAAAADLLPPRTGEPRT